MMQLIIVEQVCEYCREPAGGMEDEEAMKEANSSNDQDMTQHC